MPHHKITRALVDGLPYQDATVWYHDTALKGFKGGKATGTILGRSAVVAHSSRGRELLRVKGA